MVESTTPTTAMRLRLPSAFLALALMVHGEPPPAFERPAFQSHSQTGQDDFARQVYAMFPSAVLPSPSPPSPSTSQPPPPPPRYFVELGAVDGIYTSNTIALERQLGWAGLCIEPSHMYQHLLRSGRTCAKSDACVGPREGDAVDFVQPGGATTMETGFDPAKEGVGVVEREAVVNDRGLYSGITKYLDRFKVAGPVERKITRTLAGVLDEHRAPRRIDYLSLDTEGSELAILRTFPFGSTSGKYTIGLLSVEHNLVHAKREAIREHLQANNMVRAACLMKDDMYVDVGMLEELRELRRKAGMPLSHILDPRGCDFVEFTVDCTGGGQGGQEGGQNGGHDGGEGLERIGETAFRLTAEIVTDRALKVRAEEKEAPMAPFHPTPEVRASIVEYVRRECKLDGGGNIEDTGKDTGEDKGEASPTTLPTTPPLYVDIWIDDAPSHFFEETFDVIDPTNPSMDPSGPTSTTQRVVRARKGESGWEATARHCEELSLIEADCGKMAAAVDAMVKRRLVAWEEEAVGEVKRRGDIAEREGERTEEGGERKEL